MEVCFVHIFIFILKNIIAHKIDPLTHEELFGAGDTSNDNQVSFVDFLISTSTNKYLFVNILVINYRLIHISHHQLKI